jgi:hypothetical protein
MPNPAIQRLIAAGASPQRAKAFTDQVMKKKVGSTAAPKPDVVSVTEIAAVAPESITAPAAPTVPLPTGMQPEVAVVQPESNIVSALGAPGVATQTKMPAKGANSWYDQQVQSAAQAYRSGQGMPGYVLPEFGTPDFQQFYDYTKGAGAYNKLQSSIFSQYAPTYKAALTSTSPLDKAVTPYITKGISPTQIVDVLMKSPATFGLTSRSEADSYVNKLFGEYNAARTKASDYIKGIDQNYKFAMPDPKLTYGASTNWKAGTVDVLNNKLAFDAYKTKEKELKASKKYSASQIAKAMTKYKSLLAADIKKKGYTPYKDETLLRDSLS